MTGAAKEHITLNSRKKEVLDFSGCGLKEHWPKHFSPHDSAARNVIVVIGQGCGPGKQAMTKQS